MKRIRTLIMGAAGRDFHSFNVVYRDDDRYEVVGFTAAQIPNISGRRYPPELSGPVYPEGIAIWPEEELAERVRGMEVRQVVFSYSDASYADVMHRGAVANAAGAGKSQTSRKIVRMLRAGGWRVAVVRHPMPYGDLAAEILRRAEEDADVIVWDGGNNDLPFYRPDLHVVVADPLRPGDELGYYPGEANLRMADCVVINKVDAADVEAVETVRANVRAANPDALVVEAASPLTADRPERIQGKRVLVIEDGPTLTHGEMSFGAGTVLARRFGAADLVDPRPYAVGSLADTFRSFPGLGPLLPAMGYGEAQVRDLEATIAAVPCDLVVVGTPIDLTRIVRTRHPVVRVRYELQEIGRPDLSDALAPLLARLESPVPA